MDGVKILHTADLHIGSSRANLLSDARALGKAEIKNTFFRILDLCKKESVDFLLIAGDLFDSPFADSETIAEVTQAMSEIPETIIAISPGNHDCASPGSIYLKTSFPPNVVVFTSFAEFFDFPQKNVRLFGAAFTDRFEKIPLLPENPDLSSEMINICVLHGDVVSALSESDYNPITVSSIATSGFDYLALGHIHKRTEIQKCGNTFYSYCGCPDGKGFDEDGSRGVYLGTVKKGSCQIDYVELSSRQYIIADIDVSDCENSVQISSKILSQLESDFPKTYAENLYRISISGTIFSDFLPNIGQIEAMLSDRLLYIRITDKTDIDLSDVSKIAHENSLRGIFVAKMLERIDSADSGDADKLRQSLRLGLRAFEREVTLSDN